MNETLGGILFAYVMGMIVTGFGSCMWYDLTYLHAYPKKEKIMDLSLAEWTTATALFWPITLLTALVALVYAYGKAALVAPTKIVKKISTGTVNSIEKRISA